MLHVCITAVELNIFSNSMLIFLYHQNYCKDCRSTKTLTAI